MDKCVRMHGPERALCWNFALGSCHLEMTLYSQDLGDLYLGDWGRIALCMKKASSGYSENLSQKHKQNNICFPGIDKILEHFQGERTQRWMPLESKHGFCS